MNKKNRLPWMCQDCRTMMQYDEKMDMYKCPICGCEVWPERTTGKKGDEVEELMKEFRRNHRPAECMPSGTAIKGGGGSNNAGKKDAAGKKKSTQQLYNQLFKQV